MWLWCVWYDCMRLCAFSVLRVCRGGKCFIGNAACLDVWCAFQKVWFSFTKWWLWFGRNEISWVRWSWWLGNLVICLKGECDGEGWDRGVSYFNLFSTIQIFVDLFDIFCRKFEIWVIIFVFLKIFFQFSFFLGDLINDVFVCTLLWCFFCRQVLYC